MQKSNLQFLKVRTLGIFRVFLGISQEEDPAEEANIEHVFSKTCFFLIFSVFMFYFCFFLRMIFFSWFSTPGHQDCDAQIKICDMGQVAFCCWMI